MNIKLAKAFVSKYGLPQFQTVFIKDSILNASDGNCYYQEKVETDIVAGFDPHVFDNFYSKGDSIKKDGNVMTIKSEKGKFRINCIDEGLFINTPEVHGIEFEIVTEKLLEMIENVSYCIPHSSQSLALTGMNFRSKNGEIIVAGTDRTRIIEDRMEKEVEEFNKIVPIDTVNKISKILKEGGEFTKVTIGEGLIKVVTGNYSLVSTLIGFKFIEYDAIINKDFNQSLIFDTGELKESLKKLGGYDAKDYLVSITGGNIVSKGELGDGYVDIECEIKGQTEQINLNGSFLGEACKINKKTEIKYMTGLPMVRIDYGDGYSCTIAKIAL